MSEYNRHKWAMEWMHGGGRDPNGRSLDDEIRIGKEDWMERQRVAQGGRIELKPGGLVEPGVMNYGTEDTWSIYKITRPGHPHQGKWAHRRPNKSIDYYDTKAQAQRIAERAKVIQYEAMEKPTTKAFQKKVKNLLDDGITKSQVAKKLEVNFKVVDRAIEEGNIKWKFEPYINVPKNLNYIKKNYGKKSRETMAKELFPDKEMPMSTKESRVGKLSQKLFDTGELKPTRVPTKEHAKKHGYYKDPEHEIVARVKKAKRDAVKARSVESIETAYSGTKKTQLSHMDDIYSQFTTGETLGYAPDKINQEFLKEYDNKMKSLYKKRDRLLKEKPKDLIKQLEQINKTGARLAGETGGYKSFKFVDPYTLKPYQFGVDAAKTIDPLGILEGKTIQEASMSADPTVKRSKQILDLSPVDRYFFEKNRKAVLASQKTVPTTTWRAKVNAGKAATLAKALELKGIKICQPGKVAEGGRIGFAGKCGVALAADNPNLYMKLAKESKGAEALFKSGQIGKYLKSAKTWAGSNLGPLGWIGGEFLVIGLGGAYEISQGKGWKEALDTWTGLGGHFGMSEKRLKEIGKEQGWSDQQVYDAMKFQKLLALSQEGEKKDWELEQAFEKQDIGGTAKYKTDPGERFIGERGYIRGKYQDPKFLRNLKKEVPEIWKEGGDLYKTLMNPQTSAALLQELQDRKKYEELEKKKKIWEALQKRPFAGQQLEAPDPSDLGPFERSPGHPEYTGAFTKWQPYAEGGIASLKKK